MQGSPTCVGEATSTRITIGTCTFNGFANVSELPILAETTLFIQSSSFSTTLSRALLHAPLIQINQRDSLSRATFPTAPSEPTKSTSSQTTGSPGISTSTRLILALALPLGLLGLACIVFGIWLRIRRRKRLLSAMRVMDKLGDVEAEKEYRKKPPRILTEIPNSQRYEMSASENAVEVLGDECPEIEADRSPVEISGNSVYEAPNRE